MSHQMVSIFSPAIRSILNPDHTLAPVGALGGVRECTV